MARIRMPFTEKSPDSFSQSERETLRFEDDVLGFKGCEGCEFTVVCNGIALSLKRALVLDHMVIELSELKRDMKLNAGRQASAGVDLTLSQEEVQIWADLKALKHPDMAEAFNNTSALLACVNCPERFDAVTQGMYSYIAEGE